MVHTAIRSSRLERLLGRWNRVWGVHPLYLDCKNTESLYVVWGIMWMYTLWGAVNIHKFCQRSVPWSSIQILNSQIPNICSILNLQLVSRVASHCELWLHHNQNGQLPHHLVLLDYPYQIIWVIELLILILLSTNTCLFKYRYTPFLVIKLEFLYFIEGWRYLITNPHKQSDFVLG